MKPYQISSLNDLSKSFICSMCNQILMNPVQCGYCEDIYCKACFTETKDGSNCLTSECQNKPISIKSVSKKWLLLYESISIACPHESEGCKQNIPILDLENHMENECFYRLVPCNNEFCEEKIKFYQLNDHANKHCKYLICECPNKQCEIKLAKMNMLTHYLECPFLPSYLKDALTLKELVNKLQENLKKLINENSELKVIIEKNDEELKKHINLRIQNLTMQLSQKKTYREPKFDYQFSRDYFELSENESKARWLRGSQNMLYSNYHDWPSVRVNQLFSDEFEVVFSVTGRVWFGVASENLRNDGFPGYLPEAWIISSTEGILYSNRANLHTSGIKIGADQLISFKCNPRASKIVLRASGMKISYFLDIPQSVYFFISSNSPCAKLHSVYY